MFSKFPEQALFGRVLFSDSSNPGREISTEPCMVFITEKASHAKQHKKSTQSGEFYMILIVFYGGHAKSNEKATQNDEKKSTQNCQIWRPSGARISLSFGSGRPARSIIKSTKKTENVKASARIWTSFSFRRTSRESSKSRS